MPFEVKLPDIGEGVAEGEIVRWLVKVGDAVKEDQPLVEVMTDKASVEIPSPRTGTIAALLVVEGQIVPVGTVLVAIDVVGAGVAQTSKPVAGGPERPGAGAATAAPSGGALGSERSSAAVAATGPAAGREPPAAGPTSRRQVQATPAVRALAKELGVTLESVAGTGPGGAISSDDVKRAASGSPAAAAASTAAGPEERVPVRGLRRRIAEHMRRSLETAAHFTFVAECDLTAVVEHRERLKSRAAEAGVPLTYLAYVVHALIEPLRQFPWLNASLDDEAQEVVLKRYYHVGIATSTDEGLTVPVIHDADRMSLFAIAREIQRLAVAARQGKLKLEELQGGTFTVTSTGARGGLLATPILHHPQVAILGVHEVKKRPAVVDGAIVARDMTNLSLSLDHRVVDGAVGADFLYALIARLQTPESWLTEVEIG